MDSDNRVRALDTALEPVKPGRRTVLRVLFGGAAALLALPLMSGEADAAKRKRRKRKKKGK